MVARDARAVVAAGGEAGRVGGVGRVRAGRVGGASRVRGAGRGRGAGDITVAVALARQQTRSSTGEEETAGLQYHDRLPKKKNEKKRIQHSLLLRLGQGRHDRRQTQERSDRGREGRADVGKRGRQKGKRTKRERRKEERKRTRTGTATGNGKKMRRGHSERRASSPPHEVRRSHGCRSPRTPSSAQLSSAAMGSGMGWG